MTLKNKKIYKACCLAILHAKMTSNALGQILAIFMPIYLASIGKHCFKCFDFLVNFCFSYALVQYRKVESRLHEFFQSWLYIWWTSS